MAQIEELHFRWSDAWHNIDHGIDTIIEKRPGGGQCGLLVVFEGKHLELSFDEESFIEDLKHAKIEEWDHKVFYNARIMDGTIWELSITYDKKHIEARGYNGFPISFLEFLEVLYKYGCPHLKYAKMVNKRVVRETKTKWMEHSVWPPYMDFEAVMKK